MPQDPQPIIVRVRREGWEGPAKVVHEGYVGQMQQGVLVIDEGDIHERPNPIEAAIGGYEIVEASDEAIRLLLNAGYRIKGLRR